MAKDKTKKKSKADDAENPLTVTKPKGGKSLEDPTSGDQFNNEDNLGATALFAPTAFEEGIVTTAGTTNAIRGDVYVLTDGDGDVLKEPTVYKNTLLFGKVITSTLRGSVGKYVLGTVAQGAKKPGQSAPWILEAVTDKKIRKAAEAVLADL